MTAPVFTLMPVKVKNTNQAGWWTPFCLDYAGSQYFAFVADSNNGTANKHNIGILRRDANGDTQLGYLRNRDGRRAEFADDSGHNQPSMAIDPDGNIFVITSMHGDYWNYYRSATPRDVASLAYAAEEMPDTVFNFTYPVLTTGSNGDVYLMVRGGASPNGFDRAGIIYRRDRARATWERLLIIANEANNSFYPDDLRVDTANNVHILWEWGPWMAGVLRHKGSYLVADASGAITSISGRSMQTPVAVADDGDHVYHPLEDGEEFVSNDSAQVGTMAGIQTARLIYNAGTIYGVIYRHRPFRDEAQAAYGGYNVNIATFKNGAWTRETILDLNLGEISTTPALGASVYGTEKRLYISLLNTAPAPDVSVLVMARTAAAGGWEFIKLGPTLNGTLRFSVVPTTAGDLIYVTAPAAAQLYLYEVPKNLTDITVYASAEDLVNSL